MAMHHTVRSATYKVQLKSNVMSVLKVIEILGNSTVSFEDAIQNIIDEAAKSVKDIKSVYINDMQATVKDNKIAQYRVNAKVTFGVH
jgi:flavin-binding protein dodecin